jgi:S1-C subfamily serine protease
VPGDLLDLILIAVIAAFAVAGYRQGFIIGILSLLGFVAGIAIGAYLAPGLSRALATSASWQAFLAILAVFVTAVVGMLIASGIGVTVRSRLNGRQVTLFDSLGGAAVNVIAVVIVAWLIGSLVGNSPQFSAVSRQVADSAVLRTVDKVMPSSVLYLPMFPQLRSLMSHGLYSQVFDAIGGAQSGANLANPNPTVIDSAGLTRDTPSIVKVTGTATTCSLSIEGSGFVISPHHVLTNAHVVAGVDRNLTVQTAAGTRYTAQVRVVLYDPETDVAVLDVPGLTAPPLSFTGAPSDGTDGVVAGYPLDQDFTPVPATIGVPFQAIGPDIYSSRTVNRQVYPIRAKIEPGNSGGPLLSTSGDVYGVVFAASTDDTGTGYALTASQVSHDVTIGSGATGSVNTEACQDG